MKTITHLSILMKKAKALGNARKEGNKENIEKCEKELKEYELLCLKSDEILTGFSVTGLNPSNRKNN